LKEEDTKHIMVECPKYENERNKLIEKIIMILAKLNTRDTNKNEIEKTVPMWFVTEDQIKHLRCI
jgi:hypothetical protein